MAETAPNAPNAPRMGRKIVLCAGVLTALATACYQPKVMTGHLKCSIPAGECPDGFTCSAGSCVSGSAAVAGQDGGGNAGSGAGGSGGGGSGGAEPCATPIGPLCTTANPQPSGCDPVCQTGCGCGLRCTVTPSGNTCVPPAGSKSVGQICQLGADDCAPGLACLQEACGHDLGRCYRFCREGSMCAGSKACTRAVTLPDGSATGQRVCDVDDQDCDPYATNACPDPALHCYVRGGSSTSCDCPSGVEGKEGAPCSAINDCLAGLACLQVAGRPSQCLRLCRSGGDCGTTCQVLGAVVSYCVP